MALGDPQQQAHRIAERRRFDDPPQDIEQRRVEAHERSPSGTLALDPAVRRRLGVELLRAASERRARVSSDLGDSFQTATTGRTNFNGGEQSPSAVVELRADTVP